MSPPSRYAHKICVNWRAYYSYFVIFLAGMSMTPLGARPNHPLPAGCWPAPSLHPASTPAKAPAKQEQQSCMSNGGVGGVSGSGKLPLRKTSTVFFWLTSW